MTRLDLAVMTHGDQDHMNGIRYLLEHPESGIRVGGLMMPEAGKDEIYGKMAELAKKRFSSQHTVEFFKAHSDFVIENNGSVNDTFQKTCEVIETIKERYNGG